MTDVRAIPRAIARVSAAVASFGTAHLLLLLAAARRPAAGSPTTAGTGRARFVVVIPAHDEETQIAGTLRSLARIDYPPTNRRIVVIADNCEDATADVARECGAEVWERDDVRRRGKGHALVWAFERILAGDDVDAVCVVDADCEAPPTLLSAFDARLSAGADACQAGYLISDPAASQSAALRWAGFALFNGIRPLGRDRLGLSCGLLGTGMAFSRALLTDHPWQAVSFAEDREQHMLWALQGARVRFCPEAVIQSAAAPTTAAAGAQETRWESGRLALARALSPKLLVKAARGGDPAALDAALEPLLPSQSLLITTGVVAWLASRVSGAQFAGRIAELAIGGQVVYVVVGLRTANAPPVVWRALRRAPAFVLRRLGIFASFRSGGAPAGWVRTPRDDG